MAPNLPPLSLMTCDEATAHHIHDALTALMAYHPQATSTFQFYDEIDTWLGPWGATGYPLGYGKFYNIAFTTNVHLKANPVANTWVKNTTIKLQEFIRDYLVSRVRDGSLPKITEPELRKAAFDSHPKAYDQAGLSNVITMAPELLEVVATIPGAEFNPLSSDFCATVKQVFTTIGLMVPKVFATGATVFAGPAHTGVFPRAAAMDRRAFTQEQALSKQLGILKQTIQAGKLDSISVLDSLISQLKLKRFPDEGFARFAREVIQVAQSRRDKLQQQSQQLLNQSAEVRQLVKKKFPGL